MKNTTVDTNQINEELQPEKYFDHHKFQNNTHYFQPADLELGFVELLFDKVINNGDKPDAEPTNSARLQKLFNLFWNNESEQKSMRISKIKEMMRAKFKNVSLGSVSIEKIALLENSIRFQRFDYYEIICEVLLILTTNSSDLFQKKCFMMKLIKLILKLLVIINENYLKSQRDIGETRRDIFNLRTELNRIRIECENRLNQQNILAVKSFTFGMAEIISQETNKLRSKLDRFKESFRRRLMILENKYFDPSQHDMNKHLNKKKCSNGKTSGFNSLSFSKRCFLIKKAFDMGQKNEEKGRFEGRFKKVKNNRLFSNEEFNAFTAPRNPMIPKIRTLNYSGLFMTALENINTAFDGWVEKPQIINSEQKQRHLTKIDDKKINEIIKNNPKSLKMVKEETEIKSSIGFEIKDRMFWNYKKAIFCWDKEQNIQIVCKEIANHLISLLGTIVSPQEPIVQDLKVKSFTKSLINPNLLAIKIIINSRYRELVREAWKKGSPSEFFKFKIDLLKQNSLRFWDSSVRKCVDLPIKNIQKMPARYNYSQAHNPLNSRFLNKFNINSQILIKFNENQRYRN